MYNKGVPIKQIACELNMSKNTVKSLIKKDVESKYSRTISPTIIDEHKDIIRKWYLDNVYKLLMLPLCLDIINPFSLSIFRFLPIVFTLLLSLSARYLMEG